MDLGTMGRKLRAGAYLCVPEFEADVVLIAANAARYNGADSTYTHMAAALRDNALRLLSALPESELDARGVQVLLPDAHTPGNMCAPVGNVDMRCGTQQQIAPTDLHLAYRLLPPALSSPFLTPVPSPARTPDADAAAEHLPREHEADVDAATRVAVPSAAADADEALSDYGPDVWRACMLPSAALRLPPLPHAATAARRRSTGTMAAGAAHGIYVSYGDEAHARAAARASIMPLLRGAGFSGVHTSAVDTLADVVSAHCMRLGAALRRLADDESRTALGEMRAQRDALTPVAAIACLQRAGPLAVSWQRLAAHAKAQREAVVDDNDAPSPKRAHLNVADAVAAVPMLTQHGHESPC
jgi:hypothetical protein